MTEAHGAAPGRVNLLGEHTDYNDGLVLPVAIPMRVEVDVRPREDDRVVVHSDAMDPSEAEFRMGDPPRPGDWTDYVRAALAVIAEEGHAIGGLQIRIRSEVPVGSGLSSSAALLVALLRALRTSWSLDLDERRLVALAHRAETVHVGVPVGILDPMACAFADQDHALFIDTRTLASESIALPREGAIVVVDSGQRHHHGSGEYRARRRECEEAAAILGLASLRDAEMSHVERLPPPLDRRVRHVLTENERVVEGVAALKANDGSRFGELLFASHASMRDDYACSTPEIDRLVEVARRVDGVLGARLTGGGFGGAILAWVDAARAAKAARQIADRAGSIAGLSPRALVPRI